MSQPIFGQFVASTGPLHMLRPGVKLLGLFLFALATMLFTGVPSSVVLLTLAVTLALIAGVRAHALWRLFWGFAIVAVLLFAFHLWQHSWQRGVEVVADLFALILAASALTASTAVADMLETFTFMLRPLAVFGVRPERIGFALTLVITMIPRLLGVAIEAREAARARGLERDPRAVLVPFVLRTVAEAQLTGEALHARGFGDDE